MPALTVAKFEESKWLSATWLTDEMPEMIVFTAWIAGLVSALNAHAAWRAMAIRRNRHTEAIQDSKDILAVQRRQRDAPRR